MIKKALSYQERLTGDSLFITVKRYSIFVFGGFTGWLALISIHTFFRDAYGFNPLLSYAIGMIFADLFTFVYHRLVTFKVKTDWKRRFVQFTIIIVILSATNWTLFSIARGIFDLPFPDIVISFVITAVLSIINFVINRLFIFKQH